MKLIARVIQRMLARSYTTEARRRRRDLAAYIRQEKARIRIIERRARRAAKLAGIDIHRANPTAPEPQPVRAIGLLPGGFGQPQVLTFRRKEAA